MSLTRRRFLGASAAAGALVVARPQGVLARQLPSLDGYGTPRASRLFPGEFCVHTDMHNHSLLSDGDGQPSNFYGLMRESGIDAAALTDHSVISDLTPFSACGTFAPGADHTTEAGATEASKGCQGLAGLNEMSWRTLQGLADGTDAPGDFAAVAGFEWSSPVLGHVNVWFSQDFTDPLHTGGLGGVDDLLTYGAAEGLSIPPEVLDVVRTLLHDVPVAGDGIVGLQQWLKQEPGAVPLGGGRDGIFGFNHPGREPARFEEFAYDADLVDRCVSMELFNKTDDYLFERVDAGMTSPLVACLDAGWRPGILGTSDYHGTDWGTPDDRGRAGMFVTSLSRDTIRDAMQARRFFASRVKGLRLDATANGGRMGSTVAHRTGPMRFQVDLDRGAGWYGKRVDIQVLQTGRPLPTVLDNVQVTVPRPDEPVISFDVPVDVEQGRWVVLRFTDPDLPADEVDPDGSYTGYGRSFAYASPFYLDPDAAPVVPDAAPDPTASPSPSVAPSPSVDDMAPLPVAQDGVAGPVLPVTGGGRVRLVGGAAALGLAGLLGLRTREAHHHDDHGGAHP